MSRLKAAVEARPRPQWPVGQEVWGAKPGLGTFLTLEFGAPIPSEEDQRKPHQHGEWHLWVRDAHWEIRHGHTLLVDRESSMEAIAAAVRGFDRRPLVEAHSAPDGEVTLRFDGDMRLILGHSRDPDDEDWDLFQPDGTVFVQMANGRAVVEPA